MTIFASVKGMFERHYVKLADTSCNTCSTATWAINRHEYSCKNAGLPGVKSFFTRFARTDKPAKRTKPAMAAKQAACACEDRVAVGRKSPSKILVVCKSPSFSKNVIDYALDIASKTGSGIVALSLDENGHDFKTFQTKSEQNIDGFSSRVCEKGLEFCHMVEQGAEDSVVAQLYAQEDNFRYVMNDVASDVQPRRSIPVYTRATLRAK